MVRCYVAIPMTVNAGSWAELFRGVSSVLIQSCLVSTLTFPNTFPGSHNKCIGIQTITMTINKSRVIITIYCICKEENTYIHLYTFYLHTSTNKHITYRNRITLKLNYETRWQYNMESLLRVFTYCFIWTTRKCLWNYHTENTFVFLCIYF